MGSGSSREVPAWAPASLAVKKRPSAYLELRHPNGSVVHVVGTKRLSPAAVGEARRMVQVVQPDSVLIELCEERIASTWELIQQGVERPDKSIRRPLPSLSSLDAFKSDARLRSPRFWFWGLDVEGVAALLGTTVNATQAGAASEASRVRAQAHQIDRRESATAQRCAVAAMETINSHAFSSTTKGGFSSPKLREILREVFAPAEEASAFLPNLPRKEELLSLRAKTRKALDGLLLQAEAAAAHEEEDPLFAALTKVVLDERDAIFAHRCWECLAHLGPGGVAVAVVNEDHLPGIHRNWAKTDPETIKKLLQPRDAPDVLAAAAPAAALAFASAAAVSYAVPPRGGRLLLNAALLAPLVAGAYFSQRALTKYSHLRNNLQTRDF